jgi:hypothetical protein
VFRQRPLLRLAGRDGLEHRDLAVVPQLVRALEQRRDVVALEVRVQRLARLPALDEGQAARVVGTPVQRVEDAAGLAVRGLDQRLERLERVLLLAALDLERPGDDDFRHAILLSARGRDGTRKGSR